MAREIVKTCDICRKPTKKIAAKLNLIPMIPGVSRGVHSNYTHHADVGECCFNKLMKGFNFRPRMTREEYMESRRAS